MNQLHLVSCLVGVAVSLGGCRDYLDAGSRRLDDFHVLAGRPAAEGGPRIATADLIAGRFVSTDAHLVPLRDHLRAMPWMIRGDLLGDFTLTLPRGLITTRTPAGTSPRATDGISFSVNVDALLTELQAVVGTPFESWLRPPLFDLEPADLGPVRGVLDHLTFTLLRGEIDVRWATIESGFELEIHLPFDIDVDPGSIPIDPPNGRLDLVLDVGFTPKSGAEPPVFLDYFAPGHDLAERFAAISLDLHVGSLTGFGDALPIVQPTLMRVVRELGFFLLRLRRQPEQLIEMPDGVLSAWCAGLPGGCPFTAPAVAVLESSFEIAGSGWELAGGGIATLASTPGVFNDAVLELLASGGALRTARRQGGRLETCPTCSLTGSPVMCEICTACTSATGAEVRAFCDDGVVQFPDATASGISSPPSPLLARIEEAVFALADQLRGFAAAPLESWTSASHPLRYRTIGACPGSDGCPDGATGMMFTLPVDDDGDGVPFVIDNCPDHPNLDQADVDGDGRGDVCDPCPSVPGASPADRDGDGIPDTCDCDADGDACRNSVVDFAGAQLCKVNGEIFDEQPRIANPSDEDDRDEDGDVAEALDWDGDGVMDDCDADDDGDGVADTTDNCRWVPNPDQADSNDNGVGNACDISCTSPSDPHCDDLLISGDTASLGLLDRLGLLAGLEPWCIVDGPGCMFLVGVELPQSGPQIVLRAGFDGHAKVIAAKALGLQVFDGPITAIPDRDGDARPDLVIGVPSQDRLLAVSSATGKRLWTWPVPITGRAGAALAADGNVLWVGVPGAKLDKHSSPGAVLRVELGKLPRASRIAWGKQDGERFGSTLAAATIGGERVAIAGAPAATHGNAPGRFTLLDGRARQIATLHGLGAGAKASLIVEKDELVAIAVAAPGWGKGKGAVALHEPTGERLWLRTGTGQDHLGAALAILPVPGGTALVAGAPGAAAGAGRIIAWSLDGSTLATASGSAGAALGTELATLPDLDGDGKPELAVGATAGYAVLSTKK